MKILYLNPGADMGGAETSLTDLLAGVRRQHPDWPLHLITGGEGPLLEEVRGLGVKAEVLRLPEKLAAAGDSGLNQSKGRWEVLLRLGKGALSTHSYGRLLAQSAARLQPDIIHATGLKMQILAALYLKRHGRILWHIHDYVGWRPVAHRLLGLLAHRCDGALVNSDSVAVDLRRCCPRLRHLERLYNAVDVESLAAQPPVDLDAAAGVPPPATGTLRIGLVATYARWKGQETYLDALALLPKDLPWRAYLVGGAIYKTAGSQYSSAELQSGIERRGLAGRVFLTGFLKGRGAIMRSLDIVVHASTKPEPFGMVVIEAMACGRPVIVSNEGGAAELFREGETGLGHKPGDAAGLARQMERLIVDGALRERLSAQGKAHVAQSFSRELLAAQLGQSYEQLLQPTGAAGL